MSHALTLLGTVGFGLLLSWSLLELQRTKVHDRGGDLVHVLLLLLAEAEHIERNVGQVRLFRVVHARNLGLTLRAVVVVVDVVREQTQLTAALDARAEQLVEDVVRTLQRLLRNDTRLLQQIGLNIRTGQFAHWAEVNTDEFTESRRVCDGGLGERGIS